jgi:hypothetical protein
LQIDRSILLGVAAVQEFPSCSVKTYPTLNVLGCANLLLVPGKDRYALGSKNVEDVSFPFVEQLVEQCRNRFTLLELKNAMRIEISLKIIL